jgi:vancomycin resistance protein YoaR
MSSSSPFLRRAAPFFASLALAGTGCRRIAFRSALDVPPRAPLPARLLLTDGTRVWKLKAEKLGLDPAQRRLDLAKAAEALKRVADQANIPARNARLLFTPDGLQVTPSRMSQTVDLAATLHHLANYVASAYPPESIRLALRKKAPKITAEDLKKIDGVVAEFVTHYNPGDRPRTQNVRLVTERLNGALVPPGGVFSFNQWVGPRNESDGFQIAHVYVHGKMIRDTGGGTCQVSSTLYNAVLLGGMKIVERSNHSLTVPYVSPGRDATVYYGQRDFKFQNTSPAPVYIRAELHGGRLRIALYGQKRKGPEIEIVSASRRRGDKIFAHATRIYKEGGKIVRREPLSSDVYTPLALAVRG